MIGQLPEVIGWVVFPVIPVLLARSYYEIIKQFQAILGPAPDPLQWTIDLWLIHLGPLIGFGFLAGATSCLPEPRPGRSWRRLFSGRSVWVAVGPWIGFLGWMMILLLAQLVDSASKALFHANISVPQLNAPSWLSIPFTYIVLYITFFYSWILIAWFVLRWARNMGLLWPTLRRGVATAFAFVGSLVGGFWAATQLFRDYFFDTRIAPLLVAAGMGFGFVCMEGCGTQTVGEMRRTSLYEAMMAGWVLGLAVMWRWWSRPKDAR